MARIKLRRDTGANWTSVNPVLDLGEPGYETDTQQMKIGNGVDDWTTLPYFFGGFNGGTITDPLIITADGPSSLVLTGEVFPGESDVGLLQVGQPLNFTDVDIIATFVGNVDGYAQIILANKNNGSSSSADFVVNNNSTSGGTIYGNFGINSTGFVGTGGPFDGPNSTYLLSAGGELALGTIDPYTVSIATNDVSRIEIDNAGEVEFQPTANVHILNITDSTSHETGALVIEGGLGVGKTIVADDNLYLGSDAVSVPLTDPVFVAKQPGDDFIQAALVNATPTGSSDWIAYGSNSDEDEGWADLGFTGPSFNDPLYTITAPGDGYVFVQGKTGGAGSLVFSTGDVGTEKDIVFSTGGFLAANERIRLDHSEQMLHILMTTPSTNTMTGAVMVHGGVGIDGALNVGQGFNKVTITPPATSATLTLGNGSTLQTSASVTVNHQASLTFPSTAGVAGALLTTNGSGTLSWTAQADVAVTKLPYGHKYSTDYLATVADNVITVDPNGVARTITLPDDAPQGKIYTIKKTTAFAGPTVTVTTNNVFCTIDGATSYPLNNQESVTVVMGTDGTNNVYYIIGKVV